MFSTKILDVLVRCQRTICFSFAFILLVGVHPTASAALKQLTNFSSSTSCPQGGGSPITNYTKLTKDGSTLYFDSYCDAVAGKNPTYATQLFKLDVGTSTISQITAFDKNHGPYLTGSIRVSSDGGTIAFVTMENADGSFGKINILDTKTSNVTTIVSELPGGISNAVFSILSISDDGASIIYSGSPYNSSGNAPRVYYINRDGSDGFEYGFPFALGAIGLSGDGSKIFLTDWGAGNLHVGNADGTGIGLLTEADIAGYGPEFPQASYDAQYAIFISTSDLVGQNQNGTQNLFRINTNTKEVAQVTHVPGDCSSSPCSGPWQNVISADGLKAVYMWTDQHTMLTRSNVDGSGRDNIVSLSDNTASGHALVGANSDLTKIAFWSDGDYIGENPQGFKQFFMWVGGSPPLSADLSLSITDTPDPVFVGENLTYRLIVRNTGPDTATNTQVTDTLPGNVTLISLPTECSGSGTITCNLGSLSSASEHLLEIVVRPTEEGVLVNVGTVSATEQDPDATNNSPPPVETSVDPQRLRTETVYLLLHGLNSDPGTAWNQLVKDVFGNTCPTITGNTTQVSSNKCYRYQFESALWPHGDGLSLAELGEQVRQAVSVIEASVHPAAIVLVGHSRGGLAARAYLQGLSLPSPVQLGLLTIGTPHQGSPLGRIKLWLDANGYQVDQLRDGDIGFGFNPRRDLAFMFSPSTGDLATAYDGQKNVICDPNDAQYNVSHAICGLNNDIDKLPSYVSVFGQIYSSGMMLGDDLNGSRWVDFLSSNSAPLSPVGRFVFGDAGFVDMRSYVLENIGRFNFFGNWVCNRSERNTPNDVACNGDGVVPFSSQRLKYLLPNISIVTQGFSNVPHVQETSKTTEIRRVLQNMARMAGFTPP